MAAKSKRVVITGIGLVTASGGTNRTWMDIKNGESKASRFVIGNDKFLGARIKNGGDKHKGLKDILLEAAESALCDGNLEKDVFNKVDSISTISISKPDFTSYMNTGDFYGMFNSSDIYSAFVSAGITCRQINVSAACATGLYSIINAYRLINSGEATVCLAGSGEMPFNALYYGGFDNMGVLAKGSEPENAMRPYDKNRKGFILGEGAAIILVEELERALARGAGIYCEITGGEVAFDPDGMFSFSKDSDILANALKRLKKRAVINPDEGVYINSHGTATHSNDVMETNSMKKVFGDKAYSLKISSTKPVTGHLLGGSGALGTCVAALSLREQCVAPTINIEQPDEECDLDYVPDKGYSCELRSAIAISMGFGGHVGALGMRRFNCAAMRRLK